MTAAAPKATRLARICRRIGFDRNPLRRRIDRADTAIMAGLLAAFIVGAPLGAAVAASSEHAAGSRVLHAQQAWHQVPAVLLQATPAGDAFAYESYAVVWVSAQWTAPGGSVRSGVVPTTAGKRAGSTVRIWVDTAGRPMGIPLTADQVKSQEIAAALFVPITLGVVLLVIAVLARRLLERSKLMTWEAGWALIEPRWKRPS